MADPAETAPPPPADTSAEQEPQPNEARFSAVAVGQKFEVPVLALQNLTMFPETVVPLGVGRPRSVAAVEAALATPEKLLGCITVKPDRSDDTDRKFLDFSASASRGMIRGRESFPDPMRILFKGPNGFGS